MAEVKNNFLGSKMNKDVDARIIPPGEYRNALNLQVNKSEGSSVGDLQTSLGNELFIDFRDITGNDNLECIGTYTDEKSNTIIFFLTDYNQPGGAPSYNELAENYIYMYNSQTGLINKLVEGAFLNLSITNPVIGVNLLEELLFWTDNRNQPRKINIVTAQQQPGYYTTEEQISVAKLNPYIPIEMYKESSLVEGEYETTMYDVVSEYLPFVGCSARSFANVITPSTSIVLAANSYTSTEPPSSDTTSPITAVRPEPFQRVTLEDGVPIAGNPFVVSFNAATNTVVLSTAITATNTTILMFNPNPYYDSTYIGDTNFLEDKFVKFSYRFKFDDGEYSIFAPFTQSAFIPKQDGYFGRKKNPEVSTLNGIKRTDTIQGSAGVSAGYVIKFEDNLIVPLPGQLIKNNPLTPNLWVSTETYVVEWNSPYLTMSKPAIAGAIPNRTDFYFYTQPVNWIEDDQETTFKSTIVEFMQNKVNKILLRLRLPCDGADLRSTYKITEVDILYKEAADLAVSIVDTIPVEKIALASPASNIYEYTYDSKKPFKTLPDRQLVRVYDKVPIKALAQEIISNRVVYGNYQDKATYPQYLNYNVKYSQKSVFDADPLVNNNRTSIIEYPNHSLKQNRTYQVGIILEDLFGRQSGVILSNSTSGNTLDEITYIAASLFVPYRTIAQVTVIGGGGNALNFPGYSLKVLFNSIIPDDIPNPATGWPGLYQGNSSLPNYNPLGWYSYKIVVKQVEQDYYNVYLPGVLAGYPVEPFQRAIGKTSHTVLINDNINKVPRDLQEVGPVQLQFRSSVRLYGRVENNIVFLEVGIDTFKSLNANAQYFPANTFLFADTIATTESLFTVTDKTPTYPFQAFYEVNSNPLIARLSTPAIYGVGTAKAPDPYFTAKEVISLAVLETQGDQSLLDIYWETSTVGLISELNQAILDGSSGAVSTEGYVFTLEESFGEDQTCSTRFAFKDITDTIITDPVFIDSMLVTNLLNTPRSDDFEIIRIAAGATPPIDSGFTTVITTHDTFYLKANNWFYYGFNSAIEDSYRFRFTTTVTGVSNDVTVTGTLFNDDPTIIPNQVSNDYYPLDVNIHHFDGWNGSNVGGGRREWDQKWTILSVYDNIYNEFVPGRIVVSNSAFNNPGKRGNVYFAGSYPSTEFDYSVALQLTDAGGALSVIYPMRILSPI
jgi:hypothetical protein